MGKTATPSFAAAAPTAPADLETPDSGSVADTSAEPAATDAVTDAEVTEPAAEWVALPWLPILRKPKVALATLAGAAVAGVLVALSHGGFGPITAALQIALAALLVVLAVTDLAVQRLPDTLVLPANVLAVLGTAAAALTGEITWHQALIAGCAMVGLWTLFYAIAFFTGGLGFGDVKLAGLIGVVLGTQGIGNALAGSFFFPSLCAVPLLIVLLIRGAGRKTAIPFGPMLALGAILALIFHQDVSDTSTVLSWQF